MPQMLWKPKDLSLILFPLQLGLLPVFQQHMQAKHSVLDFESGVCNAAYSIKVGSGLPSLQHDIMHRQLA